MSLLFCTLSFCSYVHKLSYKYINDTHEVATTWHHCDYLLVIIYYFYLARVAICVPSEQFIKRKSKWKSRIFYIKYCSTRLYHDNDKQQQRRRMNVCLKLNFSSKHDEKIWIIMLSVKYDKWNENFNLLCCSSSSYLFTLYNLWSVPSSEDNSFQSLTRIHIFAKLN